MLEVAQLLAHLKFTTPAKLPYWMGSAFRGAFGQRLRQVCCVSFNQECRICDSQEMCLFYHLYMRERASRGHAKPIKPLILIPPFFGKELYLQEAGFLDLELLLVGNFGKYLPHVILGLNLLGQRGLGSMRYANQNRFILSSVVMKQTQQPIFDGVTINLTHFQPQNVATFSGCEADSVILKFRTPYTGFDFPPAPDRLLDRVRNRLIRLVNEYGTQERIPEAVAEGEIVNFTAHCHELKRRSNRSDKTQFKGYTGIVSYKFSFLNTTARWLLRLGAIIGCGPDAAFGCGFFDIQLK